MPGIAGIIRSGSLSGKDGILDQMVRPMMRESFYSSGTYSHHELGLSAGWVCHKQSFSDCLPAWNEQRDVCLLFAGENFADKADIESLRGRGHQFNSQNASYLVHLYEEKGIDFLAGLNGWFSGVLVDLRQDKIILFNDRYGLGRVYFHENAEGIFFASEAKSLLAVLPKVRQIDLRSLGEYCSIGCALQNRTLFSEISLLPPASRWTFCRSQPLRKEVYFQKETWENQPRLAHTEYYDKLKETFPRILSKYVCAEKSMAMSLTGGLDARMIMAWSRRAPGTLPCYTFGSTYRDCTDVAAARKVAKACGQPHQVIPVDGEFLTNFPAFAEKAAYVSDGAMDVTGSVELYVNQIVREIAPVRLTGNYGSEILRGNVAFRPHSLNQTLYDPEFLGLCRLGADTYANEAQGHPLSFIAFKQTPWHHHSRLSVEQSQLTLRAPYLDNDLVALAYQTPLDLVKSPQPALRLVADGHPALSRIATDRGLVLSPTPLISRTRNLYQEFTFRAEYAYDYGMPQWLARIDHLLAPVHPEKVFLGRHKFSHFRVWYRDRLANYLKEVLLDPAAQGRGYLRPGALERIVNDHIQGRRNYTSEIHQALSCELLQRVLLQKGFVPTS